MKKRNGMIINQVRNINSLNFKQQYKTVEADKPTDDNKQPDNKKGNSLSSLAIKGMIFALSKINSKNNKVNTEETNNTATDETPVSEVETPETENPATATEETVEVAETAVPDAEVSETPEVAETEPAETFEEDSEMVEEAPVETATEEIAETPETVVNEVEVIVTEPEADCFINTQSPETEVAETEPAETFEEEASEVADEAPVETAAEETAETPETSETFEDKLAEILEDTTAEPDKTVEELLEATETAAEETAETSETFEDKLAEMLGDTTAEHAKTSITDDNEALRALLQLPEDDIIARREARQRAIDDINELMAEMARTTEEILEQTSEEADISDEDLTGISFEDFKNSQGKFSENKAYMNGELYTGNIVLKEDEEKIVANYDNGKLVRTIYCKKDKNGNYEPKKIKKYEKEEDGTKIIKISNKRNILFSDYKKWFTDKIVKINNSEVSILEKSFFDDFLGTYYKRQKDGTWKGLYEERKFDYDTGYSIVPRDIKTNRRMSRKEYKNFFKTTKP